MRQEPQIIYVSDRPQARPGAFKRWLLIGLLPIDLGCVLLGIVYLAIRNGWLK
jgi:hypothetical protein